MVGPDLFYMGNARLWRHSPSKSCCLWTDGDFSTEIEKGLLMDRFGLDHDAGMSDTLVEGCLMRMVGVTRRVFKGREVALGAGESPP